MIGAAGSAQAGPQNVIVTINMAVIRTHPEGKRLGPLISAVPQWEDFIQGTKVDPLRDTDWVSINGPSLIHSEKDVILVHYSASDAVVDQAIVALGKKHGHGGPADVGVPGVKAVHGYADRAERIFLRPQPHVLAVVPTTTPGPPPRSSRGRRSPPRLSGPRRRCASRSSTPTVRCPASPRA